MERTILLAEQDPELAELFERFLNRHGYRVVTAFGGIAAHSLLQVESPSAIIVSIDLFWGGADGLLECLLQEADHCWNPRVVLTGCTADENVANLRENPCVFRYLRKPFLMGKLLDCIHAMESECTVDQVVDSPSSSRRFAVAAT